MTHKAVEPLLSKIKRAETHIKDLHSAIRAFYNANPYQILPQVNPENTEWVWSLQVSPIPNEIDCIAADAIHNLRTPLDKMLTIGAKQTDFRSIQFPIGDGLDHFKIVIANQAKYLPGPVIKFLQDTEAYVGGHGALLHAMHHLDRSDKHHSILTPIKLGMRAVNAKELELRDGFLLRWGSRRGKHLVPVPDARPGKWVMHQPDPMLQPTYRIIPPSNHGFVEFTAPYNDMEIFTTTIGAKANIDVHPSLDIAFSDFEVIKGEPAIAALHKMRDVVEGIILRFEKAFLS